MDINQLVCRQYMDGPNLCDRIELRMIRTDAFHSQLVCRKCISHLRDWLQSYGYMAVTPAYIKMESRKTSLRVAFIHNCKKLNPEFQVSSAWSRDGFRPDVDAEDCRD